MRGIRQGLAVLTQSHMQALCHCRRSSCSAVNAKLCAVSPLVSVQRGARSDRNQRWHHHFVQFVAHYYSDKFPLRKREANIYLLKSKESGARSRFCLESAIDYTRRSRIVTGSHLHCCVRCHKFVYCEYRLHACFVLNTLAAPGVCHFVCK